MHPSLSLPLTLTEGESDIHNSQGVSGTLQGQGPTGLPDPTGPTWIDPLEGFEAADPPVDLPQGRGHRTWKPLAYIQGIADDVGSSMGHANAPAYLRGLPPPTDSSALATLIDLEEATNAETDGETHLPLRSPAAAEVHDVGDNLTSINNTHSCNDWPQWDASIKQELRQHADVAMHMGFCQTTGWHKHRWQQARLPLEA
jgi:hypothetical protein